jgi:hypothetical protein
MGWLKRSLSHLYHLAAASALQPLRTKLTRHRWRAHAHPQRIEWGWETRGFNRIALVSQLVLATGGLESRYLEIGCAENQLFDAVASWHKTGVDPERGGTHRMTSDAFFATNLNRFDVIFIDGLHTYAQVRRDALNALKIVAEGGWIAIHDLLPADWMEHHVPRLGGTWTGDGWKLAVELSGAEGVEFHIVAIDYGVGLLRKTAGDPTIPDRSPELQGASFERFLAEVERLPILGFADALNLVRHPVKRDTSPPTNPSSAAD